ncbi:MAG: carbon starvation protein A [Gammaproteobacteria bacterium]
MHATWIAIATLFAFFLAYRYYSRFIAEKIYRLDRNFETPANRYRDDIDYVPTNKYVLWGHHFTSIAGASPILGPAIAVYWGWLPALLWVVLGTIFAAGVHDFGALVISIRNKGQSIGSLAYKYIGRRAKLLFLFVILLLLLMVTAVFSWLIANLFISFPTSVVPIFIQIPLAIWIGYSIHRRNKSMLIPAFIALVIMYATAIAAGEFSFLSIDLVAYFGGENAQIYNIDATALAFCLWIVILLIYVYIASTLPVWQLLQPRDYINAYQLVVGLSLLYLGLFIANPIITAPMVNATTDVSWFPLLFITIACGAISGFHSLVSSGTTAKQLNKETDARFIGYSGALGEGILALIAIIAVVTFFNSEAEFITHYQSYTQATSGGLNVFIQGAGKLLTNLHIPHEVGVTIISVIVISFAATSLDSAVRLMRYIIGEIGYEYKMPFIARRHVATSIAVGFSAALVFLPQGPYGFGSGGYLIWPLFGTTNQLLAGVSLLIITIWLYRSGRNFLVTLIPMIFLFIITLWALTQQVIAWSGLTPRPTEPLLFTLGAVILSFSFWIIIEAILFYKNNDSIQIRLK